MAVVLVAAYSLYWRIVADRVEEGIAEWSERQRRSGYDVHIEGVAISGYPFAVEAHIGRAVLARAVRPFAWEVRLADTKVTVPPWAPHRADLRADTPSRADIVDLRSGAHTDVRIGSMGGHGTFDAAGALRDGRLRLDDVRVERARQPALEVATATLAARQGAEGLSLDVAARDLRLEDVRSPSLGSEGEYATLSLTASTPLPQALTRPDLSAWRDRGGEVALHDLDLRWGPLDVAVSGTLGLDRALQPGGRFDVSAAGYGSAVAAAAEAGLVTPEQAAQLRALLDLAASRPEDGGPTRLESELAIRDSRLFAGVIPLADLPRVVWPAE